MLLWVLTNNVNRYFVLSFKDKDGQKSYKQSYFPTYDNIRKILTGQGDHYSTGCLLDYPYFKKYFKLIAIDLGKQQKLDTDPRAV